MSLFDSVKKAVTTREAAEHYGVRVGRNGMCRCPFHSDHDPSMKVDKRFHSITSSVLGLSVSLFGLLSVIEFFIGYWQNGIAFMALAFLVSPIGLPAIATLLLNLLDHLIGFFEGLVC